MKSVEYKGKKYESITEASKQLVNVDKMKVREVADALGVSYLSVYIATKGKKDAKERAKLYDVARRRKIGQAPKRIAEKLGLSIGTVLNVMKKIK